MRVTHNYFVQLQPYLKRNLQSHFVIAACSDASKFLKSSTLDLVGRLFKELINFPKPRPF
ncbi:hypothetical protein B9Q10_00175 [Candidatus Marsarchaeota G2 archaeon ECH_B_SAG-E12]|uniref:Uncharacterized protein n=1 Tax=Candidatus Marsarchaeota G2 archaeon ECH_B_SAG-E12 TaxID=1978164 RepID=A0A2R6BYH2_9ARCH|nr:MAG: hypothetical protein B9Q10_00175 [Candidatus Marsarchaeota G2 archaeon ECH_B_SAG-E12]